MANRRGKVEVVSDFLFLGSKIIVDSDCSHKIKRCLLLGRKAITNLDRILKSRDITLLTTVYNQSYGFSGSHVQMWEWNHKEGWVPKNWWFRTVMLENTLENPMNSKEIKPVIQEDINPEYSLERLMLKLQYFGLLMERANSLEKTLILWKIEDNKRRTRQRMRC